MSPHDPGPDGRQRAGSGSPYERTIGFSRAVRDGDHVYVAGTAPVRPDGEVDPDHAAQARRCWEIAVGALRDLGGDVTDVVRTRQYLTADADPAAVGAVHGEVFGAVRPASTMVVVAALLDPERSLAADPDPAARKRFTDATGLRAVATNSAVLGESSVIVLAVKPQVIAGVLGEVRPLVRPAGHLVVSIAAGVTLRQLADGLGPDARVVRVMPNTPCLVGAAASAFASARCTRL